MGRCGLPVVTNPMPGMACISREQCCLDEGHAGPCLTARQVIA